MQSSARPRRPRRPSSSSTPATASRELDYRLPVTLQSITGSRVRPFASRSTSTGTWRWQGSKLVYEADTVTVVHGHVRGSNEGL
jgi:hypothetical protein